MHGCFANMLPVLDPDDRAHALHQGLSAVALDCAGMAPRFAVRPLPGSEADVEVLTRWFRQFVEVRDSDGAERCIVSAVRAGADDRQLARMLFAAATDHRYIRTGHVLDFTNKALESLDAVGWDRDLAERVLASLATEYAVADRMEESNAWRHPVDVVGDRRGRVRPAARNAGRIRRPSPGIPTGRSCSETTRRRSRTGCSRRFAPAGHPTASRGSSCAPPRSASRGSTRRTSSATGTRPCTRSRSPTPCTRGCAAAPSRELVRGIFDAAMSIYLDRFLNVPAARLPEPDGAGAIPMSCSSSLPRAPRSPAAGQRGGRLVAAYLAAGGEPGRLQASLGAALLREDRDFHTIQCVEAAFRQFELTGDRIFLIAAARYLAAHAPTVRAQSQTFHIARRLHRGEKLYEDDE